MGTDPIEGYLPAIETVARSAAPVANRLDRLAYDREDYRQELACVALQAQGAFRRRVGFCGPHERRYVLRSLWNHLRSRFRSRVRVLGEGQARAVVGGWDVMDHVVDAGGQHEARELLAAVGEACDGAELELIARLAQAGGHVPRAHDPDQDGSISAFRRRVRAVRERVRSLR